MSSGPDKYLLQITYIHGLKTTINLIILSTSIAKDYITQTNAGLVGITRDLDGIEQHA